MKYSISKAISHLIYGTPAPLECYISDYLQKYQKSRGSIRIPLSSIVGGDYLVEQDHRELIDILREDNSVLSKMTYVSGYADDILIPKATSVGTFSWSGEAIDSDITTGAISISRKTIGAGIKLSRKIVKQVRNYDDLIIKEIGNALSDGIVRSIVAGNGIQEPLGLFNMDGLQEIYIDDFDTPNKKNLVKFPVALENLNLSNGTFILPRELHNRMVANPEYYYYNSGKLIGDDVWVLPETIIGTDYNLSNDYIYYGDLSSIIAVDWGTADLVIDSFNADGSVTIYGIMDFNFALKHGQHSFMKTADYSGELLINGTFKSFDYSVESKYTSFTGDFNVFNYGSTTTSSTIGLQTNEVFNYNVV